MWDGETWIPSPPSQDQTVSMHDSVIMGDVSNQTTVYVSNNEGNIENLLELMLESYENGEIDDAEGYFQEAKKISISRTIELHNKTYRAQINKIRCRDLLELTEKLKPELFMISLWRHES